MQYKKLFFLALLVICLISCLASVHAQDKPDDKKPDDKKPDEKKPDDKKPDDKKPDDKKPDDKKPDDKKPDDKKPDEKKPDDAAKVSVKSGATLDSSLSYSVLIGSSAFSVVLLQLL